MASVDHGPTSEPPPDPNLRSAPRTALFVAAVVVMSGQANPTRIRNLSPSGALIEGPVLPRLGETVTLVRAHLRMTGKAAWVHDGHCGLVFDQTVDVAEWMARLGDPSPNRIGIPALPAVLAAELPVALPLGQSEAPDPMQMATVIALLEAMADRFADDPEIPFRHSDQMKALARALQILRGMVRAC